MIRLAAVLLALGAMPASACSCTWDEHKSGKFLHANMGDISLPANALGILYLYQPTLELDIYARDRLGDVVLRTVPKNLTPEQFDFRMPTS